MKQLLTPYKTKFTKVRVGRNEDGGYILLDEIFANSPVVYAYGIGGEMSFELASASLGKEVFGFDHTIAAAPNEHSNFLLIREPFSKDFYQQVSENGHSDLTNMTLKMDVEGAEWEGLLHCHADVFTCFSMITLELHNLKEINELQKNMLNRLLSFYTLFHIHSNNYGPRFGWLPDTLEVSLVRNDYVPTKEKETIPYPIEGLDWPNDLTRTDYPLDWWVEKE